MRDTPRIDPPKPPAETKTRRNWLYANILTIGYMISRGLAKSGSRERYDSDDRTGDRR